MNPCWYINIEYNSGQSVFKRFFTKEKMNEYLDQLDTTEIMSMEIISGFTLEQRGVNYADLS